MKLHRHYKNKPYRVLGIAKHSETLEELVVYETLYDNPTGKLWVRPRSMFEGTVTIEGQAVPRFSEVPLQIEGSTQITETVEQILSVLIKEIFGEWDPRWFHSNLMNHPRIYLQIATVDGKPVGFKLGYELDQWCFHSWLGGVLPEYQGLGIAFELMQAQHEWCRARNYRKVQTSTQNRFRNMLSLNIRAGFDVIGYHSSDEGGPKILLEKKL